MVYIMKKLHPKQSELYKLIKNSMGEPLTIREITEILNLSSTSVTYHHLMQLEKKGYIKRNPSNPSDYQILLDEERQLTYINLYGLAECGPNGKFIENAPIDRIPISNKMLSFPSSEAFLVKAKGDSMKPKISDGDLVIAKKSIKANTNDIIVCTYNNKALIKKLLYNNKIVELHSINQKYKPILVKNDSFQIAGIVKGLLSYNVVDND